jgi:hypothetical protein
MQWTACAMNTTRYGAVNANRTLRPFKVSHMLQDRAEEEVTTPAGPESPNPGGPHNDSFTRLLTPSVTHPKWIRPKQKKIYCNKHIDIQRRGKSKGVT